MNDVSERIYKVVESLERVDGFSCSTEYDELIKIAGELNLVCNSCGDSPEFAAGDTCPICDSGVLVRRS